MTETPGKILVVDDDRQARLKLERQLASEGYSVRAVDGGAAAFAALAEDSFDLILLDIVMPEVDGYQVLKALKADDRLSGIPVIVVSALEDQENESLVMDLGAAAYLAKSVDGHALNAQVRACLR